ncbi:unnamed protein product [Ascophyllum nodosum]
MMVLIRTLVVTSLLTNIMSSFFARGNAEPWSTETIPSSASSPFLYYVDVFLGESAEPRTLGIRNGQTVIQAAKRFCLEHGFGNDLQAALIPQLVKVLQDGMATSIEGNVSTIYDAALPSLDPDQSSMASEDVDTSSMDQSSMASEDVNTSMDQSSMADGPIVTLDVSLDGMEARTVNYYAGQDPMNVAAIFCAENLDLSSPAEAFARCSNSLSASIIERIRYPLDAPSGYDSATKQQQQDKLRTKTVEPWLTVPLNVNGLETVLQIYWGSSPDDLAADFCRREEFGFYGSWFDSCFTQIAQIVRRAILIQGVRQGGENAEQGEVRPFTLNIPVTLAGRKLHVEFRTSETPRESALRFCVANLLAIESALGVDHGDGNEYSEAVGYGGMGEAGYGSDGRDTLRDVCMTIVEDAINAVLLGLRKRVAEAEMALANATKTMTD